MGDNKLYYGDNLDILRQHIADESVDLIYLDPPFNSNADYAVFFKEKDGTAAASQIQAFKDTWHWDQCASRTYEEVVEAGGAVSEAMQAFRKFLGTNDLLAYLTMMAPRLKELHRVLRPTGSIYLHCDPTASHYLKMLMDAVFGPRCFLSEVIWKRTSAHVAKRYGPVHDVILFYAKTNEYVWTGYKSEYDPEYVIKNFTNRDEATGRLFQAIDLTGSGPRKGDSGQPWRGISPRNGKGHWALPGAILDRLSISGATTQDNLDALDAAGRIFWPRKTGGRPRLKWFADELEGASLLDVITTIPPIGAHAAERLHYPTQKPVALLKQIVLASCKPGDAVLDPFCGCGTTIDAVERVNRMDPDQPPRRWTGIDITHIAVNLIKYRLNDSFGDSCKYEVIGEPSDLASAAQLAEEDHWQFQCWALGLVRAWSQDQKKGSDRGVDGVLHFHDEAQGGETKKIIFSVKGGKNLHANFVHELRGVVDPEKASIGVLISMYAPTEPMRKEAASAGFYESPCWGTKHPRLQLLTIEELLAGKKVDMPPTRDERTFKRAERFKPRPRPDKPLPLAEDAGEQGTAGTFSL